VALLFTSPLLRWSLLFGSTLLVYSGISQAPFVFDDVISIVYNPHLRSLWPDNFLGRSTDLDITPWGRPWVAFSLALNYQISGLQVWSYHLVNLLIHLANGGLLLLFLQRLFRDQCWSPLLRGRADEVAFMISLLWLLHPLGTSVTTYTVQRAESMMSLCYLATLYAATRWFSGSAIGQSPGPWPALTLLACASGMWCKETMITAPLAVLALGLNYYSRTLIDTWQRQWGWWLGLVSTWSFLAFIMSLFPRNASVGFGVMGMSAFEYALIQTRVVLHYFRLALWPVDLSLNYPRRIWPLAEVPPGAWPLGQGQWTELWPAGVILAALVLGGGLLAWRRPGLAFLIGFPVCFLAPTSSFIPIATSVAADHRMYLPCAAVIAGVVLAGFYFLEKTNRGDPQIKRSLGLAVVLLTALILGGLTWSRNHDYRDGLTVWEKSLRLHPLDAAGWNELGGVHWMRGEIKEAAAAFSQGAKISRTFHLPRVNLAVAQWNLGQKEEAIALLQFVLLHEPHHQSALMNLGLYATQLRDLSLARSCYERVLAIDPQNKVAKANLAQLPSTTAVAAPPPKIRSPAKR
jgi:protein O-mannosyl-transferase